LKFYHQSLEISERNLPTHLDIIGFTFIVYALWPAWCPSPSVCGSRRKWRHHTCRSLLVPPTSPRRWTLYFEFIDNFSPLHSSTNYKK